jgi:hypothetical protein
MCARRDAQGTKTSESTRKKTKRLEGLLLAALENGDRKVFEQLLIDLGQPAGSPEHDKSMAIFDSYQQKP